MTPSQPAMYFIGTGCSTSMIGAVVFCEADNAPGANVFFASWASTAARTMDLTGGCVFMCEGGTCVVRNDGLPVELLRFGVE